MCPGGRIQPDVTTPSQRFSRVELLSYAYETEVRPSLAAALGVLYSLSNTLDRLGTRRTAFEDAVRAALADAATTPFRVRLVDSALLRRRPEPRADPANAP